MPELSSVAGQLHNTVSVFNVSRHLLLILVYVYAAVVIIGIHKKEIEGGDSMGSVEEQKLFLELTDYEKKQVGLKIDGEPASPMQIVHAHMMKEENGYMRDYVLNESGDIKEVRFTSVNF